MITVYLDGTRKFGRPTKKKARAPCIHFFSIHAAFWRETILAFSNTFF